MASITSSGIGSGLDVNSLVAQLVAAERTPHDLRLTRIDSKLTTQFTALSQLKGTMSAFQTSLTALKDASKLIARKATLSEDTHFSASATGVAAPGAYDVEVMQLAKAAQLSSAAIVGGPTTVVGTGTLTLSLGANAFSVTIDSTNNTVAGIRDAINAATDNTGVRATILTGVDGSRLVLSGAKTGAANSITVTQTGTLEQLVYDPPNPSGLAPVAGVVAQDAIVNISGFPVHSATNTVEGAIDGVTLTLKKPEPGTLTTLTVANDDAAVQGKVTAFVSAYNTLATQIAKLRSYDPALKVAGPMLGDAMLLNIEAQLRRTVGSTVTGAIAPYATLADIGVTFSTDGTLALDATKFQAAMTANSSAVSTLFGSANGIATKLSTALDGHLATGGDISARDASITAQRKDLTVRQEALNARMVVIQARYQKQFTALDSLLSRMQSTSTYLTQQLAQSTNLAKSAGT